jgi:hypothetical protein
MMIKVSELIGADLDYWVAKAFGAKIEQFMSGERLRLVPTRSFPGLEEYDLSFSRLNMNQKTMDGYDYSFHPSTNWNQGGPIIEREKMSLGYIERKKSWLVYEINGIGACEYGETPLIAAMRAFVASKFGEEVGE